jgi:hypothetical protein
MSLERNKEQFLKALSLNLTQFQSFSLASREESLDQGEQRDQH